MHVFVNLLAFIALWPHVAIAQATPPQYVDINLETISGFTVDKQLTCKRHIAEYVSGGDVVTGLGPMCGLGSALVAATPADALKGPDLLWLETLVTPIVVKFQRPQKTVFVFGSIDHTPVPEEGIEETVWGSNSPSITNFPAGWTLATLNAVWKKGWSNATCPPGPNSTDFNGQYSFAGHGYPYIAIYANGSVSIFNTPAPHAPGSWSTDHDDLPTVPGWQSLDAEIDAVGAPDCDEDDVIADAGFDQVGDIGDTICFESHSRAEGGIATIGWDSDRNGTIDINGPKACIECDRVKKGVVTLFVTNECGCTATDKALFFCAEDNEAEDDDNGGYGASFVGAVPLPPVESPIPIAAAPISVPPIDVPGPAQEELPPAVGVSVKPGASDGDKEEESGCTTTAPALPLLWLVVIMAGLRRRLRKQA